MQMVENRMDKMPVSVKIYDNIKQWNYNITEYGLYSKKLLKSFRLQNVGYWEKGQRSEGTKFRRRV